jgi:GMP synthase-like glutamine amidotransferase
MRIHYLQHAQFEGPAYLEDASRNLGAALTGTRVYAGEPLPDPRDVDLLAVMGGPMGVYDEKEHPWLCAEKMFIEKAIGQGMMVIGICLGAQLVATVLEGKVVKNPCREIGWFPVSRTPEGASTRIGRLLPGSFQAFHWHGDTFGIPEGALRIAESVACKNQGFLYDGRVLALQFHLEATAASVSVMLDNCGADLDGSAFVQGPEEIMETSHIPGCNALFDTILQELVARR